MLFASMALTPFAMGEGVVATAVSWGADSAFLGISLATDVPEYLQQRDDFKVALGSSIVLGTNRLSEEELKRTEWFSLFPNLLMNIAGAGASTARMLELPRMVAEMRTNMIIGAVERGGADALRKMPQPDQIAFLRYSAEAKLIEASGDTKLLTKSRLRASEALDKIAEELEIKSPREVPAPHVDAIGDAAPRIDSDRPKIEFEEAEQGPNFAACHSPCTEVHQSLDFDPITPDLKPSGMPHENQSWSFTYEGKPLDVTIGKQIGQGNYATVYELKFDKGSAIPGCEKGCVIKFYAKEYVNNVPTAAGKQAVYQTQLSSQYLGDIPQLEIKAADPAAPVPYVIQERLQPNMETFEARVPDIDPDNGRVRVDAQGNPKKRLNTQAIKRFAADEGLQRSVVELFYKIAKKGLIWEDAHLGNMYFFKDANGKWVAGVLDQDRIIPFAQRDSMMGRWMSAVELFEMPNKCRSMYKSQRRFPKFDLAWQFARRNPLPQFPDAFYFMEKMFEYKAWVLFDENVGEYQQLFIKPEVIRERFPQMFDKARLDPLPLSTQPTKGFWQSRVTPLDLHSRGTYRLARDGVHRAIRMAA
jgi:hypothetical protein